MTTPHLPMIPMVEPSVFVFGDFVVPDLLPPSTSGQPPLAAVEILREFSPREFIGKVYHQPEGTWRPLHPTNAARYEWYNKYQSGTKVYFEMRGAGRWEVEWFRSESNARSPNPYLAVALRRLNAEGTERYPALKKKLSARKRYAG